MSGRKLKNRKTGRGTFLLVPLALQILLNTLLALALIVGTSIYFSGRGWQPLGKAKAEPSPKPTNPEPTPSAAPPDAIEGRDATADPCVNGLGLGTEDMVTPR